MLSIKLNSVLTVFPILFLGVECATQAEIDQHLNLGMTMLAKGQYSDALSHFHAAVGEKNCPYIGTEIKFFFSFIFNVFFYIVSFVLDADPSNYMSYYKRATVFLALSRSRPALADLDKVLQLKADFTRARVQRATVLLKMGRLDEAHIDAENVLRKEADNEEANRVYTAIDPLQRRIREAQDFIKHKNFQVG
jgi:DnaJ family protein C protein 3